MNQAWLTPALIGIDQPVPLGHDGPIGELLLRIVDGEDHALNFARGAGVLAACALAAASFDAADVALPAAAELDTKVLPGAHPWARAIATVFGSSQSPQQYDVRLKYDACQRLAAAQLTLPTATLPAALDAGQRAQSLRPALLPVLGHRGRWLAAQNPDWKYAAGVVSDATAVDDPRIWQEGNHLDRLAYFGKLRFGDAGAARALLHASLGELAAKERLDFVTALRVGLDTDDLPLLEPLLKDRSREVRLEVARLLALLPSSAHAQRLLGWMTPLLVQKRGLLGKSWQIDAPEAADADWAQAMIEPKRPQHEALGERAWWLYQLVRQVPLAWWVTHTGMKPKDLVAWAEKTEWAAALHRGWRERVGRGESDWVEALLGLRSQEARAGRNELLALLPVAEREKHWPNHIDALWKEEVAHDVIGSCALGETLSLSYSKTLLPSMLACFNDDRLRHDYGLRAVLLELAALIHADAIGSVRSVARRADETPAMAECAQAFEYILQVRAILRTSP